jgi:hypothetical protein
MTKPRNNLEKVLLIIKGSMLNVRDRLKLLEKSSARIEELERRITALEQRP